MAICPAYQYPDTTTPHSVLFARKIYEERNLKGRVAIENIRTQKDTQQTSPTRWPLLKNLKRVPDVKFRENVSPGTGTSQQQQQQPVRRVELIDPFAD